jgi:hypothetical protein
MNTIGNDLRNGPRMRAAGHPAVRGREPGCGGAVVRGEECVLGLRLTMDRIDESRQTERVFSAGHAM